MRKLICGVAALALAGCVERSLLIKSEPSGATVMLNGETIGVTPVKTRIETYGVYEAILSAPGCRRLRTTVIVEPPWFERMPLDFISEDIWPGTIRDAHEAMLRLEALPTDDTDVLIQAREERMRLRMREPKTEDSEEK